VRRAAAASQQAERTAVVIEQLFERHHLGDLHRSFQRSIVVTEPQAVAVLDGEETLAALYRAYVAPRARGSRSPTKGVVLDRVVAALRSRGAQAHRGAYIDDFIFDVVVDKPARPDVYGVLSFAAPRKDWTAVERDAGHFLYALKHVDVTAKAVVEPPADGNGATTSYRRVVRWLEQEHVSALRADELVDSQLAIGPRAD
jgi:hypothetical protein